MKVVKTIQIAPDDLLNMIEVATARGMQAGAKLVLDDLERRENETTAQKPDSDIFLGGSTDG